MAYPDFDAAARTRLAVRALINAIGDRDTVFYIKDISPTTLDDVCSLYERYRVLTGSGHPKPAIKGVTSDVNEVPKQLKPPAADSRLLASLQQQYEATNQQLQQLSAAVTQLLNSHPPAPTPLQPSNLSATAPAFQPTANYGQAPKKPCPRCNMPGHWAKYCPQMTKQSTGEQLPSTTTLQRTELDASVKHEWARVGARRAVQHVPSESVNTSAQRAAYLKARISGRYHHCLLDSGADVSLAPSRFVDPGRVTTTTCPLLAVNNTSLVVDGTIQLPVVVDGKKLTSTFFVTPNIDEFILGRDWLTDNHVVWDFSQQSVLIDKKSFRLKDRHSSAQSCKRAVTRAEVTIPPALKPSYRRISSTADWTTSPARRLTGRRRYTLPSTVSA